MLLKNTSWYNRGGMILVPSVFENAEDADVRT